MKKTTIGTPLTLISPFAASADRGKESNALKTWNESRITKLKIYISQQTCNKPSACGPMWSRHPVQIFSIALAAEDESRGWYKEGDKNNRLDAAMRKDRNISFTFTHTY